MKKLLAMVMAFVLCVSLVGCSAGVSQSEYDKLKAEYDAVVAELDVLKGGKASTSSVGQQSNSKADSEGKPSANGKFDEQAVVAQLDATEYNYVSSTKTNWTVLLVKNNSQFNLSLDASVNFKGTDGQMIGAKNASEEALEAGHEVAFIFMNDEKYDKMEYSFSAKQSETYECVQSDLSCESTIAKNKAIVSVTNNGTEAAEFVKFTTLFFNGGQIVYANEGYAVDDDHEIKPGKTINKEAACFEKFDEIKVIITGRR